MTKKKGGGGQYHLPKHLRNNGGGGGGGARNSGARNSGSSGGNSSLSPTKNVNQIEIPPIHETTYVNCDDLLSKVCKLYTNNTTTEQLLSEGETIYLKYVYTEPDEAMTKKCNTLKELYEKLQKLLQMESFSNEVTIDDVTINENVQLFEDIQNILSAISNQITHYEIKAMLYKLGGLGFVCDICYLLRYLVPCVVKKRFNDKFCTFIENSLSALTFILFKISDHTRGREILKNSGMFGTLWDISQVYTQTIDKLTKGQNTEWYKLDSVVNETVISILYHIGEILNYLTEQHSLEDDLERLLVSANPKWFPTNGIIERFGRITSDIHFAILDLPNLLDWSPNEMSLYLSESSLNLSVEDFDIHAHYPLIKARTDSKFLNQSNFVKWDPQRGLLESNDFGPGYYILRLDHHPNNTLAFVKFIQFLYCGTIKKYQTDTDYLNSESYKLNNDHNNETKSKKSETCDAILSYNLFLSNKEIRKTLEMSIPHYRNSKVGSNISQSYACIYDNTDKVLFAIHATSFKKGQLYAVDNYKKAYIQLLCSNKKISVDSDLALYFSNIKTINEQHYDIKLQAQGNIVDEAVESEHFKNILSSIKNENGVLSHRFILACRSEYLRKVLEYETLSHNPSSNLVEFSIQDISATTLYIINQYLYCGVLIFQKNPIPTECLVECFVVSDLYMLFGLKKFAEERICSVLDDWRVSFSKISAKVVSASAEMELVEELYEIATVHLAVNMKYECYELLKQYKPEIN